MDEVEFSRDMYIRRLLEGGNSSCVNGTTENGTNCTSVTSFMLDELEDDMNATNATNATNVTFDGNATNVTNITNVTVVEDTSTSTSTTTSGIGIGDIGFGDWMESTIVSDFKHSNYTYLVVRSYSDE